MKILENIENKPPGGIPGVEWLTTKRRLDYKATELNPRRGPIWLPYKGD
jgi:hypothetical protein